MNIFLLLLFLMYPSGEATLSMATTTSIEDTALLEALIPPFEKQYNIKVTYVAVGTGQAIRTAKDGNVDIIFVHDKEREEEFIQQGFGTHRYEIMQNYFVIVGPEKYKKELKNKTICEILNTIASNEYLFISRGDDSGTHSREKSLWKGCKIENSGKWYLEAGSGMIATLRVANEKQGFALSDISTYLSHLKELQLYPYTKDDPLLVNIYSLIPVSPKKFPHVQSQNAEKFVTYILKGKGKTIIKNYGKEKFGKPLFELIEKP
jgi:tungstate transport system substrate-binding protein